MIALLIALIGLLGTLGAAWLSSRHTLNTIKRHAEVARITLIDKTADILYLLSECKSELDAKRVPSESTGRGT